MHTILGVVVVAVLAFVGTMFDNFFAFAAQLVVTDRARFRRVSIAQSLAMLLLLAFAAAVGSVLAPIPVRWIGLLCVAPFGFAIHAWHHRETRREQNRRGSLTTFAITLALGGDNLAVWIPLLRANGLAHGLITGAVFAFLEIAFLVGAQRLAAHPRVVAWGRSHAPSVVPFVYVALGVLILWECHTF
ncbi:MAG: cadmium resistance transporter [Acidimicrobiales bacterium]